MTATPSNITACDVANRVPPVNVVTPPTVNDPVTLRFLVTPKSCPMVTSLGRPMVTAAVSDPLPETSISLVVTATVAT